MDDICCPRYRLNCETVVPVKLWNCVTCEPVKLYEFCDRQAVFQVLREGLGSVLLVAPLNPPTPKKLLKSLNSQETFQLLLADPNQAKGWEKQSIPT